MKIILLIAFLISGQEQAGPYTWGDVKAHQPEIFDSMDACEMKFAEVAEEALAVAKSAYKTDDVKMFYSCHETNPGTPA